MPTTTIEEDIKSTLTGITVYPLKVPSDGVYPSVTYQKISTVPIRTHSANAMKRYRFQLSVYGTSYASCVATANTVNALMDRNRTNFTLATLENEFDVVEEESNIYSTKIDFFVWTTK